MLHLTCLYIAWVLEELFNIKFPWAPIALAGQLPGIHCPTNDPIPPPPLNTDILYCRDLEDTQNPSILVVFILDFPFLLFIYNILVLLERVHLGYNNTAPVKPSLFITLYIQIHNILNIIYIFVLLFCLIFEKCYWYIIS